MDDKEFFSKFPLRETRIRQPGRVLAKSKQRAVAYVGEFESEFRSMAPHQLAQRRVLVWRIPHNHPAYDPDKPQLMPIPMLAGVDETIPDEDRILLPLLHQLMTETANQ